MPLKFYHFDSCSGPGLLYKAQPNRTKSVYTIVGLNFSIRETFCFFGEDNPWNCFSFTHPSPSNHFFWNAVQIFVKLCFFCWHSFLATFYGLYFNHQFFLHITLYNFSSSYRFLYTSVGSFHVQLQTPVRNVHLCQHNEAHTNILLWIWFSF